MSSRGFEFSGMIDGSIATPVMLTVVLGAAAAHHVGDLMLIQADDGYADQVTGTTTEVTGVCMQELAAADITAGTTTAKIAIITRNQIWRCSMDASTTTAKIGATKTLDTADCNTIDADDLSNGSMCLLEKSELDDDGNVLARVVFMDTTFGNT